MWGCNNFSISVSKVLSQNDIDLMEYNDYRIHSPQWVMDGISLFS